LLLTKEKRELKELRAAADGSSSNREFGFLMKKSPVAHDVSSSTIDAKEDNREVTMVDNPSQCFHLN